MTREEMFPQFQALCPTCYFCKCAHLGEGVDDVRMADIVNGVELFIGFYLCPSCQVRQTELYLIETRKTRQRNKIQRLSEKGFYRFDARFNLDDAADSTAKTPGLSEVLGKYPLEGNPWIWSALCGIGKTHVARCAGNRYVLDLKNVVELNGAKLHDVGEYWARDRGSELAAYQQADLLIVDDMDKALWTLKSVNMVYRIFNERYDRQLRTIVTANCAPQSLCDRWDSLEPSMKYGASIWDRMSPIEVFEMKGAPRR